MSSISSVSSATNPYLASNQTGFGQFFQDFKAIGSALQSNDLSTAQSALAAFQQDLQGNAQAAAQTSATASSPAPANQPFGKNSQANTDYQSLVSALQSNDLSAAQKAFASLQTDLKSAHKAHHHHHHPGALTSNTPASSTTPSSAVDSDGDNDGSSLNATA